MKNFISKIDKSPKGSETNMSNFKVSIMKERSRKKKKEKLIIQKKRTEKYFESRECNEYIFENPLTDFYNCYRIFEVKDKYIYDSEDRSDIYEDIRETLEDLRIWGWL